MDLRRSDWFAAGFSGPLAQVLCRKLGLTVDADDLKRIVGFAHHQQSCRCMLQFFDQFVVAFHCQYPSELIFRLDKKRLATQGLPASALVIIGYYRVQSSQSM